MRIHVLVAAAVLASLAPHARADDDLGAALGRLRSSGPAEYETAVDVVLALKPTPQAVVSALAGDLPPPVATVGWTVRTATDSEGVARPYHLYVPEGVAKEGVAAPLLVDMHGGVNRDEFVDAKTFERFRDSWVEMADEAGVVLALPLGRADCTWWSAAGIRHVRATIRDAKSFAPVDDQRVVGTGFSDGGSGSWYLAMSGPDPFAALMPMNGHPAVAVGASRRQLYLQNCRQIPLFVAMTQDDGLYPAHSVLPHVQALFEVRASVHLVSYPYGGHSPSYADEQQEAFASFIVTADRGERAKTVEWWTASTDLGRHRWVEILGIGPAEHETEPGKDLNVMSRPGRVRLGFRVDQSFEGEGVRVFQVMEDTTAEKIGMQDGDVVRMVDGTPTPSFAELRTVLGAKKHGESVTVVLRRGESEEKTLSGEIPGFTSEPVFGRTKPTAWVRVKQDGTTFTVESSNVSKLRLLLDPATVRETGSVSVSLNGQPPTTYKVTADVAEMIRSYARDADRGRLSAASVEIELPPVKPADAGDDPNSPVDDK